MHDWDTGTGLRGYRDAPENPSAVVLVIHGFGEHAGRHAATMRAWAGRGFATYAYDQRGHGRSPGARAAIDRFDDLVDDALAVRERAHAEHPALPLFVFGASLGGVVATRSVQRRSDGVRGVVLLAPAFAAAENVPPLVRRMLRVVRRLVPNVTLGSIAPSKLSRDPAVGEAYRSDPLTYHGGIPLSSAIELVDAGDAAIRDAATFAVPALVFQGDADTVVFPVGATRFANAAANARELTLRTIRLSRALQRPGRRRARRGSRRLDGGNYSLIGEICLGREEFLERQVSEGPVGMGRVLCMSPFGGSVVERPRFRPDTWHSL